MKKAILCWMFGICLITAAAGQHLEIKVPERVSYMLEAYQSANRSTESIDGWRIQLTATTSRRNMEATKLKFEQNFPQIHCIWRHQEPYYLLEAGAFSERLEALPVLMDVRKKIPGAYLTMDRIDYEELMK